MASKVTKIAPCLWFNTEAEEAAQLYTSIFKNSSIDNVIRYGKERHETPGIAEGDVMTVTFTLEGQTYTALNGGPQFRFNEAISFAVHCDTQEEIDYFWEKLSEGGDESAQVCGWLKDKFGVSWQVVPTALFAMLNDPDSGKSERVTKAMLKMRKMDIRRLEEAYAG
ncbi:VOC family protein [Paenibacillus chartarius]|uniref:VOC family protein n=1 Tax=Paenibacillus chartarius TaxID=747481 RepID=A0ABV6DEG6_9BACL